MVVRKSVSDEQIQSDMRTLGYRHIEGNIVELLRFRRLLEPTVRYIRDTQAKNTHEYDAEDAERA